MADGVPAPAIWGVTPGFAAPEGQGSSLYALYDGADYAAPGRGLVAIIAQAHPEPGQPSHAAQLAAHCFAEGYFGAQPTFSPSRAAGLALSAFNRWLAGQMQGHAARRPTPASLSALLLRHRRVTVAQIGICQLYRLRGGVLTPLIRPHLRLGTAVQPARALGLEDDLAVAFQEEEAEPGDIFLLLSGASPPDATYAALIPLAASPGADTDALAARALALLPGPDAAAMALRIDSLPAPDDHDLDAQLSGLPIRPPPKEGDVWDGFLIGKTLFYGRYTMLKAAMDQNTGREVALKIPLKSMLQDEVFAAGFMREAWIGATVRSDCVARYLPLLPGRRTSLYLAMELYHGQTLEWRLNHSPLVSLPEGLGIALKLCEAVQDLAAIQVVHRDIKPDNIMLLKVPRGGVILLDLGLAFLPGIDAADASKPGGTIRYMAPELLRGSPASARTELYALGVTIYRMFSGGPFPFGQNEKLPLSKLRPDLPRWLGEALARAVTAKPEERFADAGEFARALQAGLAERHEAPMPPRAPLVTPLRLWQGAAILFAMLSLALALKLLP